MELAEDVLRHQHQVSEVHQPQLPDEGDSDGSSEPGPGDERDAFEPVPDVWHLPNGLLPTSNPETSAPSPSVNKCPPPNHTTSQAARYITTAPLLTLHDVANHRQLAVHMVKLREDRHTYPPQLFKVKHRQCKNNTDCTQQGPIDAKQTKPRD